MPPSLLLTRQDFSHLRYSSINSSEKPGSVTPRLNGYHSRGACPGEIHANEVAGLPRTVDEVNLVGRREHGLEGDPGAQGQQFFPPGLGPSRRVQDHLGGVPVTVSRDVVGVE
jgi:hypothetical protein